MRSGIQAFNILIFFFVKTPVKFTNLQIDKMDSNIN